MMVRRSSCESGHILKWLLRTTTVAMSPSEVSRKAHSASTCSGMAGRPKPCTPLSGAFRDHFSLLVLATANLRKTMERSFVEVRFWPGQVKDGRRLAAGNLSLNCSARPRLGARGDRRELAGTDSTRSAPAAAVGQTDDQEEGLLSGLAANRSSRPGAACHR